ncbi:MAG: DMT family transporter [Actinomycetota bacterium]|nr:DMT family transporter [Actinomycetota bacterium]
MRRPLIAFAALAVAALLFGATFVVVKDAVAATPPMRFVGWRFLLGALVLFAIRVPRGKKLWRDGTVAGLFLFAGYALQTQGLTTTSASNSGLITGLYVVLTPLMAALLARRRPRPLVIGGALLAFAGFAVLAVVDDLALSSGDAYTIGCAVAFAGHIVFLARTAHWHQVVPFTAVQLLVTAVLGLIASAVAEGTGVPAQDAWPAIAITGVVVSAGAFYLQVWSQTVIGPSRTAIILALEPGFAAGSGALFLGERLGARGLTGALLILAGIYVVLAGTGPEDDLERAAIGSPRDQLSALPQAES